MIIKKVIIPVAGKGTRFLPITKSIPKEMLPIVDTPCVQFLVEEAIKSGVEEIILVINKDKENIKNYFSPNSELKNLLKKSGKTKELKKLIELEKIKKIKFVYQHTAKGDGDAILCAYDLIKNEEAFAVLFGDDIWDYKIPPLKQMIKTYEKYSSPVIALEKIGKKDSKKYGIIKIDKKIGNLFSIKTLIEKPNPASAPSNLGITGKYIITKELLSAIKNAKSKTKDAEIRIIDGMIDYVKKNKIMGTLIEGERFDTGDKLGYLKACVHFGLKDKTLSTEFKKYLKNLK
ncbi:MAG: sugar phosphate nucleotidyltransferase [Candidatus Gracilibacteria bacterium]|jgi:UTP--glucose-1-phosphate uridylyltransferase